MWTWWRWMGVIGGVDVTGDLLQWRQKKLRWWTDGGGNVLGFFLFIYLFYLDN